MVVQVLRYRAVYMHNSVCNLVECEFVSRLERETSKEMVAAARECHDRRCDLTSSHVRVLVLVEQEQ
jgi:hypothetical protein